MSVENTKQIDFISIDGLNNVVLTISDHLQWEEENHLLTLQNKINAYLEVIENGNIYEIYPDAKNKKIVIEVAMKYSPNEESIIFLETIRNFLNDKDYEFKFYHLI